MNRLSLFLVLAITTGLGAAAAAAAAQDAAPVPAAAGGGPDDSGVAVLVEVLATSDDPEFQLDILKGINAAIEGRRRVEAPAGWAAVRDKLLESKNADVRAQARALAGVFGDDVAFEAMRKTLADAAAPAAERVRALESLRSAHDPGLAPTLQALVADENADPALRAAALQGLSDYDDPNTPKVILAAYPTLDIPARNAALNTLAGRPAYAKAMIAAVRAERLPRKDLTAFTVRLLRDLGDKEIDAFVDENWGVARRTPQDKAQLINRYKQMLTDEKVAAADPSHGRAVFNRVCAQCHMLYGQGGKVGPDLTGSNRANLDYILMNVIDPSAVIARDFQVTLLRTKDGRVLSGIATETDHAVKIVSESGTVIVPRDEVGKMRLSDSSMMPEGLINSLNDKEMTDLVAYLRTTEQVPLPKGQGEAAGAKRAAGAGTK